MIDQNLEWDWDKIHELTQDFRKANEELRKILDEYEIATAQMDAAAKAYEEAAKIFDIEGGE